MRVLMLEFNELCPSLMDRFIAEGHLPNFERLREHSLAMVTDAEEAPPNLEPWIQWVTVHTGLSYAEHECFKLNDGGRLKQRRLWDEVGAAGSKAWVCGSMNAGIDQSAFAGHFMPDPWASEVEAYPEGYFRPYLDVVRAYVQEHSGRPQVSPLTLAKFIRFMVANGLRYETIVATMKQLASERRSNVKWRRAMILDRLQWDLFAAIYRREQPRLATFFLNSTAHFQHFHWREMTPDIFLNKPSEADTLAFRDTIRAGYENMDRIVGKALDLADDRTAIVLATALSQQPMLTYEDQGGRQIFRHHDIDQLLRFAGIDAPHEYRPVMSQQFLLHFENGDAALAASEKLGSLILDNGRPVMWAVPEPTTPNIVNAGCLVSANPEGATVRAGSSGRQMPFDKLFYPLEALRSGMHHPDGMFWVSAPGIAPRRMDEKVPLTAVHPTVLTLLGIDGGEKSAPSLLTDGHAATPVESARPLVA